ncbi:MAG TPA: hypothetical protein VN541_18450 [Tepidisphaeraceae bacterium]|nr:hypothetical protein [Tepidisphaeraceae bacterium]
MLWTLASFGSAVGSLFGYGLMISGAATCIWMPLSHLKPFESRRVFGVICAALALLTAGYKLTGAFGPKSAEAGPSTVVVQTPQPATAPAAQQVVQGSVWPDPKTGDRSLAAAQQVPAKPKPADALSDRYVDNANGYSIQFPVGWSSKTFASGQPWFVDVSDGKTGLISVGFSPFPSSAGIDQIKPAGLKSHILARPSTRILGQGHATIAGQKALWFRYCGPIDTATGTQTLQVVHYYVPLHDGRMLELRMGAAPADFGKVAPLLKKSASTLKVIPL